MSLAGEQAAQERAQSALRLDSSNLRLGQSRWSIGGGLGIGANDNINLVSSILSPILLIRPELDSRMVWPLSTVNSLSLHLGGGYSAYATHSQYDRWFLNPGSELSFDLSIGDLWINLHDRFSVTESTYQDPRWSVRRIILCSKMLWD